MLCAGCRGRVGFDAIFTAEAEGAADPGSPGVGAKSRSLARPGQSDVRTGTLGKDWRCCHFATGED